jgi:L-asparaginase
MATANLSAPLSRLDLRESDAVTDQAGRRHITVFSLGGTIASMNADAPLGGVTPQLGASDLIAVVPGLSDVAEVEAASFRQAPSGDLTLLDLVALARAIEERFESGTDGVVVTQGTDTIEETSFALDLLVRSSRPVVVTGAMRNPTLAGPDGSANILASVQVAASRDAEGLGTLVVLNDEIHAARFVRKTHTSNLSTFRSPSAGPIGWLIENRVRVVFRVAPLARFGKVPESPVPAVSLFKCALGDDARILDQIEALGYAGVVVEGFGGGHVPARMVASLETLAARMPVVLASRTGSGEALSETYGYDGSERDLLSRGLFSAGVLDGLKARILLSLILMSDGDPSRAKATFHDVVASITSFEAMS